MTWVWLLVTFFAGLFGGSLIGGWLDVDYLIKVGKIKQRGRGNRIEDVIDADMKPRKRRRRRRDERR